MSEKVKKWILGAAIAGIDGLVNGVIVWSLAPETPLKATLAIVAYNSFKGVQLYFQKNPFEAATAADAVIAEKQALKVLTCLIGVVLVNGYFQHHDDNRLLFRPVTVPAATHERSIEIVRNGTHASGYTLPLK